MNKHISNLIPQSVSCIVADHSVLVFVHNSIYEFNTKNFGKIVNVANHLYFIISIFYLYFSVYRKNFLEFTLFFNSLAIANNRLYAGHNDSFTYTFSHFHFRFSSLPNSRSFFFALKIAIASRRLTHLTITVPFLPTR